jgi:hypothetical protein
VDSKPVLSEVGILTIPKGKMWKQCR